MVVCERTLIRYAQNQKIGKPNNLKSLRTRLSMLDISFHKLHKYKEHYISIIDIKFKFVLSTLKTIFGHSYGLALKWAVFHIQLNMAM